MTLAHKNATHGNERGSGEAPFLRAQQTSNSDITPSSQLSVGLNNDATTKIIQNKGLMGLGKAQLPGKTCIFDASPSRSASTTIVTGNENVVSLCLGDT